MQAYNTHGGTPAPNWGGNQMYYPYPTNGKGAPGGVSTVAQGATAGPSMGPAAPGTGTPPAPSPIVGAPNPNPVPHPAPAPGTYGGGGGGQGPFIPLAHGTPEMGAAFYRHAATSPGAVGSQYWLDRAGQAFENPLPASPNAAGQIHTDAYGNRRFDYQPGGAAFGEATGRFNPGDRTRPNGLNYIPAVVTAPPMIPTAPASIRNNLPDTGNASRMPGVRTAPSALRATGRGIINR